VSFVGFGQSRGACDRAPQPTAASANRARSHELRKAAGVVATTVMTGALTVALTAMQATPAIPVLSSSVRLLTSSQEMVTNQIIAAQQQIVATNSAYPFISNADLSSLPEYTQSLAMQQLFAAFNEQNRIHSYDRNGEYLPTAWNAPSTNPLPFSNDPTADNKYTLLNVQDETYTITITPGAGTKVVTFVPMAGTVRDGSFVSTGYSYDLTQFTPNADGSYTVVVSRDPQPGNWVNSTGAQTILMRDTTVYWGLPHDRIVIKQEGASSKFTLPVLSESQIDEVLNSVAQNISVYNSSVTNFGIQQVWNSVPANTFTPIKPTTSAVGGPILPGQLTSIGRFVLEPDQALIVKVPTIAAGYTGAQLSDAWQLVTPYVTAQGSLNGTQVFQAEDGYTYYVVSATNPGVANWLDNTGLANGSVTLRFQDVNGALTQSSVTTQVVPISDVRQHLPAETPTVTPAEYAATLKQRMFEYNYVRNQNVATGWVTANLELDQIKAAIGAEQFAEIFGSQSQVPSVLDRTFKPAQIPDIATVLTNLFTAPSRSLAAIVENLPLLTQDIVTPMVLATLRLNLLVGKTTAAVLQNLAARNIAGAIAALGAGVQGLGTLIQQTLVDPGTSVTAGFLNARDDLAVAISNAKSYDPYSLGDLLSAVQKISEVNRSAAQMLAGGLRGMFQLATSHPQTAARPETALHAAASPESDSSTANATTPLEPSAEPSDHGEQTDEHAGATVPADDPITKDDTDSGPTGSTAPAETTASTSEEEQSVNSTEETDTVNPATDRRNSDGNPAPEAGDQQPADEPEASEHKTPTDNDEDSGTEKRPRGQKSAGSDSSGGAGSDDDKGDPGRGQGSDDKGEQSAD
jgi:hypothetical protein